MDKLKSFKAYDIRGKVPSELNTDLAYKIGKAYPLLVNAQKIVIGHDIRKSSDEISDALSKGLTESGVDVIDLGLCGTEMVYYATPALEADGGIMITASHNPPEYNGMKFVKKSSVPVGYDSGLKEMKRMILNNEFAQHAEKPGTITKYDIMSDFIKGGKCKTDAVIGMTAYQNNRAFFPDGSIEFLLGINIADKIGNSSCWMRISPDTIYFCGTIT